MTDDYRFQAEFVADAAWRLLSMQDSSPLSPSHGCFHLAYWRDKTSEFPDARFQEAGATLALLSLPAFDGLRRQPAETLYAAFAAALGNWSAQQYPEGAFDEWYKGERGFAAAEFTMIAYGFAARFLGDRLREAERTLLVRTMDKAAAWLARRHDRVKTNHEAAAAAALALAWETTGDARWRHAARVALDDVLARQTPEGWFPEIGGMDLGYCSVLLDYVMIYTLVTGDETAVPAMRRLFAFMAPHIHPDGTISPEAGLCLNPYVSRVGLGLLSSYDDQAAALVGSLRGSSPGQAALVPYLADDLRLCRWSHLPLVASLLSEQFRGTGVFTASLPSGWTHRPTAAVTAWHGDGWHVYFSPSGGGVVRVYREDRMVAEDLGLQVDANGKWGSTGYDADRVVSQIPDGFRMETVLAPASFFFPGFLFRLILRVGCVFPWSSRLLRAAIDAYRLRARTAVNQSAAPIAKGSAMLRMTRSLTVNAGEVTIRDELVSSGSPLAAGAVRLIFSPAEAVPAAPGGGTLVVTKRIKADGEVLVTFG